MPFSVDAMKKNFALQLGLSCIRGCLLVMCLLSQSHADANTEQQIKLSFIYNFAKFVTWPNVGSSNAPFVLCVLGSQPLSSKIVLLQNKKVDARPIQVHYLSPDRHLNDCNMLFISESEAAHLEKSLLAIAGLPILTVSTIPDFVQAGGMIGLKEMNDRVRFDVNLIAAQKAGLSVNSQLSNLADEVLQ